jgi:hypothetical protein
VNPKKKSITVKEKLKKDVWHIKAYTATVPLTVG